MWWISLFRYPPSARAKCRQSNPTESVTSLLQTPELLCPTVASKGLEGGRGAKGHSGARIASYMNPCRSCILSDSCMKYLH